MTDPLTPDVLARALEGALPDQSEQAYADQRAGWLAQRIIGAAAVLDDIAAGRGENAPATNSVPPPLPDGFPALGGPWVGTAQNLRTIAQLMLDGADLPDASPLLIELADRLTEYADTQLST